MAHIALAEEQPGIAGLFAARPDTARPLRALADAVLHRDDGLHRFERELLATAVSAANGCRFCRDSHAAVAEVHATDRPSADAQLVEAARAGRLAEHAPPRLAALTRIAEATARGGGHVTTELVDAARHAGADDDQIHDAVLIAAAFSLFNRYVDGLGTGPAPSPAAYAAMGRTLARDGYAPAR